MEQHKIDLYLKSNPDMDFPKFDQLNETECNRFRLLLQKKLRPNKLLDNQTLIRLLDDLQKNFDEYTAMSGSFNIFRLWSDLDLTISPENNVYINWMHFEYIDKIKSDDFFKYFKNIWFPAIDDIDIFDEKLNWIISIDHDGYIKYLKF